MKLDEVRFGRTGVQWMRFKHVSSESDVEHCSAIGEIAMGAVDREEVEESLGFANYHIDEYTGTVVSLDGS